jgi:hypothetical protein
MHDPRNRGLRVCMLLGTEVEAMRCMPIAQGREVEEVERDACP